tara:strand:+ start:1835 stop:2158 length:324 start_codon:yes stop_codon:yes gene_type:complete
MLIGQLDRRVIIDSVVVTANDYGELTRTFSLLREVWAYIEWKGGKESDENNKITGMTKLHVYIRNLDMGNLDLQSRITYDGKYYFPKVINEIDGREMFLEIICENKD